MSEFAASSSSLPRPSPGDDDAAAFAREASAASSSSGNHPSGTLRGALLYRPTRKSSSRKLLTMGHRSLQTYASFDMSDRAGLDFGSVRCWRFVGLSKKERESAYAGARLEGGGASSERSEEGKKNTVDRYEGRRQLCLYFPAGLPWTVRDVENDATTFVIEVPTYGYSMREEDWDDGEDDEGGDDAATMLTTGVTTVTTGVESERSAERSERSTERQHKDQEETANESGNESEQEDNNDGEGGEQPEEDDSEQEDENDGEEDDQPENEEGEGALETKSSESSFEDDGDGVFDFWTRDDDVEGTPEMEDEVDDENDAKGANQEVQTKQPNRVRLDLDRATSRNESVVCYAFKCPHKKNEKALWIAAFAKAGRMGSPRSSATAASVGGCGRKGFFGALPSAPGGLPGSRRSPRNSRARTSAAADRARGTLAVERGVSVSSLEREDGADEGYREKEYRVRPCYAYPHRWMTRPELTAEMEAPSAVVHDLRLHPGKSARKELGMLRAEVLGCLGLPGPNKPNAIVYLVCGSYAFSTDVISACRDPMWLSAMKRACIMSIYHGYARLYAGVFHDDGSKSKDGFLGRVCVEIGRLNPGRTYDVTIPLRLSTSVYSRRKRGAVRLRLTLSDLDRRGMLLSYFPGRRRRAAAGRAATTVACADPKAFRAVALAVHGKHLPGKFSTESLTATIREFAFVQQSVMGLVQKFVRDLICWRYPVVSCLAFVGWMRCAWSGLNLAPVYALSLVLLQLVRNYARYVVNDDGDFRPTAILESLGGTSHAALFRALGLLKQDEFYADGTDTYTNQEFPFSSLAGYPRLFVEEAIAEEKDSETGAGTATAAESTNDLVAFDPKTYFKKPLPEQNMDKKIETKTKDKTLAEELLEVEEKAHKFTLQLFNDNHAYMITDTTAPPWGKQQRREKNGEEYDVKRDLDKLLGLGQFSQWNPIVSKFTVQIEPIARVFEVALFAYRSAYNIFTWRDPFLSFWVTLCCIFGIIVLLFFPWRIAFIVVGLVALGPQNLVIRVIGEIRSRRSKGGEIGGKADGSGRFLRAFRELIKSEDGDNDANMPEKMHRPTNTQRDLCPQPLFHYHKMKRENQAIGVQHIRIPYTPLLYHRFYDWPPDPTYSRVVNEMTLDPSSIYATSYESVIVHELPVKSKSTIEKGESTETQDPPVQGQGSGLVQIPTMKSMKSAIPPSTTSLPSTDMSSQADDLASMQLQNERDVPAEKSTTTGKTWSRAFAAKKDQVKFTLEKKRAQLKEGTVPEDESVNSETKKSAGAAFMTRRINKLAEKLQAKKMKLGPEESEQTITEDNEINDDQILYEAHEDVNCYSSIEIAAPPGGLGLRIEASSKGGSEVTNINDNSPLAGIIQLMDKVVAIDDEDVSELRAVGVSKLLDSRSENPTRKITVLRNLVRGENNEHKTMVHNLGGKDTENNDVSKAEGGDEHSFDVDIQELFAVAGFPEEKTVTSMEGIDAKEQANDDGSISPEEEAQCIPPVDTIDDFDQQLPTVEDRTMDTIDDVDQQLPGFEGETMDADESPAHGTDLTSSPLPKSEIFNVAGNNEEPINKERVSESLAAQESNKDINIALNMKAMEIPASTTDDTADLLCEELMSVKLELATARTENDHFRDLLKKKDEELEMLRNKCLQYEKQPFNKLWSKKK